MRFTDKYTTQKEIDFIQTNFDALDKDKLTSKELEFYTSELNKEKAKIILTDDTMAVADIIQSLINKIEQVRINLLR